ncbi:MAG: TonB-dependent receptor [Candidatus Desulfofervidaceae bacterium]|nr:TonB-dependent receptor [Candidatus Desulfofervidaceae bacterium]
MKKVWFFVLFWFLVFPVSVLAQQNAISLPEIVVTASRVEESETASAVTKITGEELQQKGITNVADALREVPGVMVTQYGFGGPASVFVRGGNNGQAVIMIDGVPVYDPSGTNKGDFSLFLPRLNVENIDRIEIVRGPQSVLYGSSAMTGVINIITKKGKAKPQTTGRLEGGSFNTFTETLGFSGTNESVSYNLNLQRFDSNGISKKPDEPDKDGYRFNNVGGSLTANINEKVEVGASFSYLDAEQGLDGGDDFEKSRLGFFQTYYKQTVSHFWQHTLKLAYTNTHRTYPTSFYDGDLYFLSWQHNFTILPYLKVVTGFDYQQEKTDTNSMDEKNQDEKAWFAEAIFKQENFYFNTGVRYDRHQTAGDKVTYRFAGAYFLPTQTKLHASFGTGFRAPSLYQLYGVCFGNNVGNPDLKPEKNQGYDAGLTQYLWQKRITLDVTYFFSRIKDMIDWVTTGPGQYLNVKEAHTQGVEISADIMPISWLKLSTNYTWLDAQDTTTNTWLPRRPKHKISSTLSLFWKEKADFSLTGIYFGKRFDSDNNPLGGYFIVNLAARYYPTSYLTLSLRVQNLLDRDYEEIKDYNAPPFMMFLGAEFKWGL